MIALLKRLFAPRQPATPRPTRAKLRQELESLASARGLPVPSGVVAPCEKCSLVPPRPVRPGAGFSRLGCP